MKSKMADMAGQNSVTHMCFFQLHSRHLDPHEPKIRLKRTERFKNKLFSPTICLQQTIELHKDYSTYLSTYMIGAVEDLSLIQCPKKYIWTLKPHLTILLHQIIRFKLFSILI